MIHLDSETHHMGHFTYNTWSMSVNGKTYYLGQDVKFIRRVLGMSVFDFRDEVGARLADGDVLEDAMVSLIIDVLGMNEEDLLKLGPWELCSE